jgi:serine/threonine-protein kinase
MAQLESLGKYRIDEVIGRGAMGVVYKAFDPNIRRTVALKTVRLDQLDEGRGETILARFKNEAQAAGRLSHPGIVAIYEYGEEQGLAHIAMEYIEGNSLREYLTRGTRFTERDVVSIMTQLLDALAYAHEQGVWHRDIKPANLIIMRSGKLKIADFGIARVDSSHLTHIGAVMGTPGYMAPEQYNGSQVDWRADLFSAGVVMYQLLTGAKPFSGSLETVAHKVCHEHPPAPSLFPADPPAPATYDAIVTRAIAKKAEQRFQSAAEFRTALLDAYAAPVSAALSEETLITEALPSFTASTATSVRTTAPPTGWDPALLAEIERRFARFVGPVAKVLVRRAGRRTLDVEELYAELADKLATEEERSAFLATRKEVAAAPARRTTQPGTRPPASRDVRLTAEAVESAQRRLAVYIGPIARVMARKAAAQTESSLRFYLLLADNLAGAERERFLAEVGVDTAKNALR